MMLQHKLDNRIKNLRDVTQNINMKNMRRKDLPVTGKPGVYQRRRKYASYITVNKKRIYLGLYDTVDKAHDAYVRAKRKYHEEFVECL